MKFFSQCFLVSLFHCAINFTTKIQQNGRKYINLIAYYKTKISKWPALWEDLRFVRGTNKIAIYRVTHKQISSFAKTILKSDLDINLRL